MVIACFLLHMSLSPFPQSIKKSQTKICWFQWFLEDNCDKKFHFQESTGGSMIITHKAVRVVLQRHCTAETTIE